MSGRGCPLMDNTVAYIYFSNLYLLFLFCLLYNCDLRELGVIANSNARERNESETGEKEHITHINTSNAGLKMYNII